MKSLFFGLAIGLATLAPTASWGGDLEVGQQIYSNLKTSSQLKGYRIGVKVNGNVAELGGTVRDEQQMATAINIAKNTAGIDSVVNNLMIVRKNDDSPVNKLRQAPIPSKAAVAPAVTGPAVPTPPVSAWAVTAPAVPSLTARAPAVPNLATPVLAESAPAVPALTVPALTVPAPVQQADYAQSNNSTNAAANVNNNNTSASRVPNTIQNTQARPITTRVR